MLVSRGQDGVTRRELLRIATGLGVLAAHSTLQGAIGEAARTTRSAAPSPIAELHLLTSATLESMQRFYGSALGLPVSTAGNRLTIDAGESRIVFERAGGTVHPFYHFAFNIPENKIEAARTFQLSRSPLLPIPERLRDPRYPPDVVDYRHWNAHSVFFLDPGGNVAEYIARHDLRNARPGAFTPEDILCVSEIGLVVDDVRRAADRLSEALGWSVYRNASDSFTAIGDERGLILVFRRGRILNFQPDSQEKAARVFPTKVALRSRSAAAVQLVGFPYDVRSGS